MANLKNSDAETKAVDREILKNRGTDLPQPMPDFGSTYEQWERNRAESYNVLMSTLERNPGISLEALSIAQRLEAAGYTREDAVLEAMRSVGNAEIEF